NTRFACPGRVLAPAAQYPAAKVRRSAALRVPGRASLCAMAEQRPLQWASELTKRVLASTLRI
ncbi:MAG: hypothetical protein BJ554DRAFT_5690, partial [Olpidium bornovanus]